MKQYLDLMRLILAKGVRKGDRTGVGTFSVFGHQMRFDLNEGFPLVTTKKVFTRGIIEELLWFMRGSTDNTELEALKVGIWDGWALKEDYTEEVALNNYDRAVLFAEKLGLKFSDAIEKLNAADSAARAYSGPYQTEEDIAKCHAWLKEQGGNDMRGGVGLLDDHEIPTTKTVVIRKRGELGPIYGAQWRKWKLLNGQTVDQIAEVIHLLKTKPNSRRLVVTAWNPEDLPNESVDPQENIRNGKQALASCHCLFQFYTRPLTLVERIQLHDKIHGSNQNLVQLDADFQANLHTANTGVEVDERCNELEQQMCAILDARNVPKIELSCQLYQRSCDFFLGVPFNIASYALLTHMIAQVCNMTVGEFVWTGGDIHLYTNQIDQANLQVSREPLPLPKLLLNPDIKNIDDFKIEDIKIVGYQSHEAIKADVAV